MKYLRKKAFVDTRLWLGLEKILMKYGISLKEILFSLSVLFLQDV
jgi:hypothetical protein